MMPRHVTQFHLCQLFIAGRLSPRLQYNSIRFKPCTYNYLHKENYEQVLKENYEQVLSAGRMHKKNYLKRYAL